MAARQAPQLRIFRNDFESSSRSLAVRLTGSKSNRDAIGARVTVQTDRMRRTKIVQAGSGFLSQHSKELLVGLGASERVTSLTVDWPSGGKQILTEVPLNVRVRIVEGGTVKTEPFATRPASQPAPASRQVRGHAASPPDATWLYEPFPAPDFTLKDLSGRMHSLSGSRGKPAVLLLFSAEVAAARTALDHASARRLDAGAGGHRIDRRRHRWSAGPIGSRCGVFGRSAGPWRRLPRSA